MKLLNPVYRLQAVKIEQWRQERLEIPTAVLEGFQRGNRILGQKAVALSLNRIDAINTVAYGRMAQILGHGIEVPADVDESPKHYRGNAIGQLLLARDNMMHLNPNDLPIITETNGDFWQRTTIAPGDDPQAIEQFYGQLMAAIAN